MIKTHTIHHSIYKSATKSFLLILGAVLLFSSPCNKAYSDTKHTIVKWPLSSKLRQSTVLNIVHGTDGMLWLVTLAGVSRFNGVEFIDYDPFTPRSGYIKSTNIVAILASPEGIVYAATRDSGLLVYDKVSDNFNSLESRLLNSNSLSQITAAFSDRSGLVWLGHRNGDIYVYNSRTGDARKYGEKLSGEVSSFTQTPNDDIYAVTKNGDIAYLNTDSSLKNHLYLEIFCKNTSQISAAYALDDQNIWLGTTGNGLFLLDIRNGSCKQIASPMSEAGNLARANIQTIFSEPNSNLTWVASDQGLYKIDRNFRVTRYSFENSNLYDDAVISISTDQRGTIWLGTYRGLNYLVPTVFEVHDRKKHERLHSIVAIENSDPDTDDIWVATYEGLLFYKREVDTHFDLSDIHPSTQVTDEKIMSLHNSANGLWIGYRFSGVEFLPSTDAERVSEINKTIDDIKIESVSSIVTTRDGSTFIGTYGEGLYILLGDGKVEHHFIGDNRVIMLYETSDGKVWIGTESGLFEFDFEDQIFRPIELETDGGNATPKPVVWAMTESPTGDLWFGTMHNGIYYLLASYRKYEDQPLLRRLQQINSLARTVYAIETDALNNIWYSTNLGLAHYDNTASIEQQISFENGLQITDFDFGVSSKDKSGNLYFGGSQGYVRFNPRDVNFSTIPSPVNITGIDTLNFLFPPPPTPTTLELTHKDYFVKFNFSVLDFLDPEKNQYRYKLEGFDPNWVDNGTNNSATYTNLPPGDYVLRVQGANSAGVWNLEGASLPVRVLPPFWKTWWAYTFYTMIGLIIFWMSKRSYDSYAIEKRANERVNQMHEDAERADDEMQEQLEIQDDLINSVYRHNTSTLQLVSDCISVQANYTEGPEDPESTQSNIRRVEMLGVLESCVYYQSEQILADLHKFTDMVLETLLKNSSVGSESIVTINEVTRDLVPIDIASPLCILIGEILENCFTHAVDIDRKANYMHIEFSIQNKDSPEPSYSLSIQDNGLGIPDNINCSYPETAGLGIAAAIAIKLGGVLDISVDKGTTVALNFPLAKPV